MLEHVFKSPQRYITISVVAPITRQLGVGSDSSAHALAEMDAPAVEWSPVCWHCGSKVADHTLQWNPAGTRSQRADQRVAECARPGSWLLCASERGQVGAWRLGATPGPNETPDFGRVGTSKERSTALSWTRANAWQPGQSSSAAERNGLQIAEQRDGGILAVAEPRKMDRRKWEQRSTETRSFSWFNFRGLGLPIHWKGENNHFRFSLFHFKTFSGKVEN